MLANLLSLAVWARRLPARFVVPLLLSMLGCLVGLTLLFQRVQVASITALVTKWLPFVPEGAADKPWGILVRLAVDSLVILALLSIALLLSYNLAAWISRSLRRPPKIALAAPNDDVPGTKNALEDFDRIGIILAGGGAKGAYQAGAMLAIHEFLEEHGALDRVRMIAGTSIGSWNAMFWLAGLVKRPARGQSAHEQWWGSLALARLVDFATYVPRRYNHMLIADPWREAFRKIFVEPPAVRARLAQLFSAPSSGAAAPIHFYFTRANVEQGRLEFSTNRTDLAELLTGARKRKQVESDRYNVVSETDVAGKSQSLEDAVFASMDLPPLFPYVPMRTDRVKLFEDGGVIDNLPMWFGTQIEQCDLLFVLPLNASFNAPPEQTSIIRRMGRVLDVRQGVLERNAFKMAYLYNELAGLRGSVEELERKTQIAAAAPQDPGAAPGEDAGQRALERKHKPVAVFAVCPGPPLKIDTAEFWKHDEAAEAFDLMYAETKTELSDSFREATDPNWIRMAVVQPQGGRIYVDDF